MDADEPTPEEIAALLGVPLAAAAQELEDILRNAEKTEPTAD